MIELKDQLNETQLKACQSNARHLRIITGAGSGKTRTLTYRLLYQITQGINPRKMLAITFTNKAATEMKNRIISLLEQYNEDPSNYPIICTYHAFCYRLLKAEHQSTKFYKSGFSICTETKRDAIFKDIFSNSNLTTKQEKNEIKSMISKIKSKGKSLDEVSEDDVEISINFNYFMHIFREYQRQLILNRMMDFDDLLIYTLELLKNNDEIRSKYQYFYDSILVDEFQDTNTLQYEIVKLLMKNTTYLTIVGDPDQNIYSFRGAKGLIIRKTICDDFKDLETVTLNENYRSTQYILDCANNLISNNIDRVKKELVSIQNINGEPIYTHKFYDSIDEAVNVVKEILRLKRMKNLKLKDFAIIYRNNYMSLDFEKQLANFNIPYTIYGGVKFFDRIEIQSAIAYLDFALYRNDVSFKRIIKAPARGIGNTTLEKAETLRAQKDLDLSLFDILIKYQDELKISKNCYNKIQLLKNQIDEFNNDIKGQQSTPILINTIQNYFEKTGFYSYIKELDAKENTDKHGSEKRTDNLKAFMSEINDYFKDPEISIDSETEEKTIETFLTNVALKDGQDAKEDQDAVNLMTCHVSKGLEFDTVFFTGLNGDTLPSNKSKGKGPIEVEEERRIAYVSMTRAKNRLYISSYTKNKFTYEEKPQSEFINEMFKNPKFEIKDFPLLESQTPVPTIGDILKESKPKKIANTNIHFEKVEMEDVDENVKPGDFVNHKFYGLGQVQDVIKDTVVIQFQSDESPRKFKKGFGAFSKVEYKGEFNYGKFKS